MKHIGFNLTDEWLKSILLAGLTDEYKPFIMGLEASGQELTPDIIICQLLDDGPGTSSDTAFKTQKRFGQKRCYICNSPKHFANKCDQKKDQKGGKDDRKDHRDKGGAERKSKKPQHFFSVELTLKATESSDEWYLDSGASCHMTPIGWTTAW